MTYLNSVLDCHLILILYGSEQPGRQGGNDVKQADGSLLKAIQLLREQSRLVQVEGSHHQSPFHRSLILILSPVLKEMLEVKREILSQEFHQTVLGLKA